MMLGRAYSVAVCVSTRSVAVTSLLTASAAVGVLGKEVCQEP